MRLLGAGLGCIVLSLVAIGTAPDYWRALSTGEFVGVEGIYTLPISPIKFTVVLGAAVAAFEYLRQLVARRDSRASIIALALLVALSAITIALSSAELADRTVGILSIVSVLALIAMGVPIAIALLSVGFAGLALVKRDFGIATDTLSLAAQGTVAEYVFATVPLFVLMGLFVSVSDIGRDSFRAAQQIFGRVRGGLGVATVAANAVFAAITGISIASAAIFAKIAVPEMVDRGYTARFAVGLTAGSSVLGMLIPPSLLLIIYGVIAEVSIGALFIAAIVPGIILAVAFAIGVLVMAFVWPGFVGTIDLDAQEEDAASAADFFKAIAPVALLIVLVLGGIYGGVFTPTEAGAAGAFAAMCLALDQASLKLDRPLGCHSGDRPGYGHDPVPDREREHVQPHADVDRPASRYGGLPFQRRPRFAWLSCSLPAAVDRPRDCSRFNIDPADSSPPRASRRCRTRRRSGLVRYRYGDWCRDRAIDAASRTQCLRYQIDSGRREHQSRRYFFRLFPLRTDNARGHHTADALP